MYPCQGVEVRAVACGGEHSLAATSSGEVYSWGWGRYGNLGLGPAEDKLLPSKVPMCPAPARPLLSLTPCTLAWLQRLGAECSGVACTGGQDRVGSVRCRALGRAF